MEQLVISKRLYCEQGCIDGAMLIKDGIIKEIFLKAEMPDSFQGECIDYGSLRILPGIIEHHIHGFKGWSAFSTQQAEIQALANSLPSVGITSFVVTNHYRHSVMENIAAIIEVIKHQTQGAKILGIHMEGPFINPEMLGSISADDIHTPDLNLMKQLYDAAEGHLLTVTLAPELKGNIEIIDWLIKHHVNPCIGVCKATYAQCQLAVEHGAILTQKTGNCMGQFHHREVGGIGAALLESSLYNEINSDLAHCSKEFLKILYKMKGYDHLLIVADNNRMSGMPFGTYRIPEEIGAYEVGKDGLLYLHDGTIDGSALTVIDGIRNWVETIHIPLEEASIMASLNPAKLAHIEHKKGSLKEGKDADFIVIDNTYKVLYTWIEGNCVYCHERHELLENKEYLSYAVEGS